MKHFVRGAVTLALLAACIGQARAGLAIPGQSLLPGPSAGPPGADPFFDFTFTDGTVTVTGTLNATANNDGTFTAISGTERPDLLPWALQP